MFLEYEGLSKTGEKIKGAFWGTQEELVGKLKQEGVFLTKVKEDKKKIKRGRYTLFYFSGDIEQISYLISSGMGIDKAIITIIKNSNKQSRIEFWENVLDELRSGKQFSQSLKDSSKKYKLNISDLYINIIDVGEEVGDLKSSLERVLSQLQFRNKLINDVKSALAYPAFLIFMSIVAVIFIVYVILPKFSAIFTLKEFDKLPFISKLVIGLGMAVNNNTRTVVFVSALVLAVVLFVVPLVNFRKIFLNILHKLPIIKKLYFYFELSNLFSSLGAMLSGGVDISRSIKLSESVVTIRELKNILVKTRNEIKKGIKISEVWKRYNTIPEDIVSLTVAGENSAKLGDVFISLGNRYAELFRMNVSKMLSLLEPIVIMFLGLFIGIVVVSIMLAVVSLNNVVS